MRLWNFGSRAGRAEGGGEVVLSAVKEMLAGLPGVTLHLNGWQSWPSFRKTVAHMNLLLQPSYTESFNMVTADGVAEGVPSVVSSAIDWAPEDWKANVDDVLDIARIGRRLLFDERAAERRPRGSGLLHRRRPACLPAILGYSINMQSPYEKKR